MKNKPTPEQRLVYKMMTEIVGHSVLDSGGIYGYNHDRNAKRTIRDFINEPEEWLEFERYDGSITHKLPPRFEFTRYVSIFHYLTGSTWIDDVCAKFNRRNANAKDWNGDRWGWGISESAARYLDHLAEQGLLDEEDATQADNTYNHDNDLTSNILYSFLKIDGDPYLLFQYHGGCDIRGGYTDAKMLRVGEMYYIHEYLRDYDDMKELYGDITNTEDWCIHRWPCIMHKGKEMTHQMLIDELTEHLEEYEENAELYGYEVEPGHVQEVKEMIESITAKMKSYEER